MLIVKRKGEAKNQRQPLQQAELVSFGGQVFFEPRLNSPSGLNWVNHKA